MIYDFAARRRDGRLTHSLTHPHIPPAHCSAGEEAYLKQCLADVMVPDFQPQEGVKIAVTDAEAKQQAEAGASSSGAVTRYVRG